MNPKMVSQEDLALFAMQLLTPEEDAEIITHLEHNEGARAELAQVQGDLAMYALTSDLHSPPAMARERLMRKVAKEKKLVPIVRPAAPADEPILVPRSGRVLAIDEPVTRRTSRVLAWAGWAVAAGLGLVAGLQFHQRQALQDSYDSQSAKLATATIEAAKAQQVMDTLKSAGTLDVALHLSGDGTPEPPKPEGHAAYVAETGSLVFVGTHMNALQAYKTYELWLIPQDGHDPIAAGLFKPDERGFASVLLPELPKGIAAKNIAISIEDDGGSKQGPTDVVMKGV